MAWLSAWLKALSGQSPSDPWTDDPAIRAERQGQHQRINRTMAYEIQQRRRERRIRATEEAWQRDHDDA
jgi:hypothetical protein